MRKRFTKIICAAVATISAFSLMLAPACGQYTQPAVEKDNTADKVTSNGGFLVETGDYVYFINGITENTAENTFGEVLKGSIQRISKSDLAAGNYGNTQTIVPLVVYSGSYNGGIYIYGDNIYYTTPTIERNADGEVLNSNLDFKCTSLDGSVTMNNYFWQSTSNTVDYRYTQVGDTVYILYAASEDLYGTGTSVTNIHSVNTATGANTLLAYDVDSYVFDTTDATSPYAYYTMNVTRYLGTSSAQEITAYNQLYRVRADVTESPRQYDFSYVEDYNAEENPLYVNLGDFVYDGVGLMDVQDEKLTQFNYAYGKDKQYQLGNASYTYDITSYDDGELLFTRRDSVNSNSNTYVLTDAQLDADGNGRVDEGWDAIEENSQVSLRLYGTDSNTYEYVEMDGKLYGILANANGISKGEVIDGKVENLFTINKDASATVLFVREEQVSADESHTYLYYSMTGSGNGYSLNRVAIDGTSDDYNKLPVDEEAVKEYRKVTVLDIDMASGWYMPEFVGNTLIFASEIENMTNYNYIMACDLGKDGYMMSNAAIEEYNELFEGVEEKITAYNDEKNADGTTDAYKNLADALMYQYYTRDEGYLDELIQAYVDIQGRDREYLYSKRSAEIYHEFAKAEGDWAEYADISKQINGEKVTANFSDYYYTVLGRMTEEDSEALRDSYKDYMQAYPVDDSTWWESLSIVSKVFFIIGMCVAGLAVIAGITVLTVWLIRRKRGNKNNVEHVLNVDMTEDKDIDVYGTDDVN